MQQPSTTKKISYNDKEVSSIIDNLDDINLESSYYLMLVVGPYKEAREDLLPRVERKVGMYKEFDLRDIILLNEEKCYKKIDELFSSIEENKKSLLFRHGDALAGEYTGFTYSNTRYATPQEKYLLKKIINSEKFVVIEFEDLDSIDKTLERYAQTTIICDKPTSMMGKFFWRLKQIHVHGHTFSNKRPKTA
ncbi:MAG: hypothetical protein U5K72_08980 [Balneolaceae bacterium]|nr:hypothetical protein [Balneolaceae bacterium]